MSPPFDVHDLVWLSEDALQPRPARLDALPEWAATRVLEGFPLVVRRAPPVPGFLPVGIRGNTRAERYGTHIPEAWIARSCTPYSLREIGARPERNALPALDAWETLRTRTDIPFEWGPGGSCAYELATGSDCVSATSDLDLVVRVPAPLSREFARELLATLRHPACRVDVQLLTPSGGLALLEWGRGDSRVMLKTAYGPVLTRHPWDRTIV